MNMRVTSGLLVPVCVFGTFVVGASLSAQTPQSAIDTHINTAKTAAGQDYRATFVNLCFPGGNPGGARAGGAPGGGAPAAGASPAGGRAGGGRAAGPPAGAPAAGAGQAAGGRATSASVRKVSN